MTTTNDIDAIRPATDLLIANLRETVGQIQEHEHPERGGDLFCLNLTSYMGDRMGPVLRRLADEQAETRKWQERHTALADEFTAEADRLNAKVDELTAELAKARDALTEANRQRTVAEATTEALKRDNEGYADENLRLREQLFAQKPVVEAAEAWAEAHEDRDVHLIRRRSAVPAVANLYDAVEQYRVMDLALTTAREEKAEVAP